MLDEDYILVVRRNHILQDMMERLKDCSFNPAKRLVVSTCITHSLFMLTWNHCGECKFL